jgi:hypothetical protein
MGNKKKFLIILMGFLSFITLTMSLIFLFIKKDMKKHNEGKENININESNGSKIKENIESNKKDKKIVEQASENKDDSSKKEEINNKKDEDKTSKQEEKPNNKTVNKPKTNTEEKKPNKSVEQVKPNTGTPPPTPKPVEKTLKQLNDEKIAVMTSRYGVKFMVRDQSRTRVGWTTGTAIYDEEKLKKVLNEIDYILSRYPTGFFKEFNSNGMSLSLNILDRINGGLYGLSDSEFLSNVVISISTSNYLYEETLHHEILHYIDNYIETKMYPASPETEYVTCNPAGFTYGNTNSSLSFKYTNPQTAYFIADYGQKNYKEDRATLFPRLMRPSITGGNDFLRYPDSPLTCKARVLIRQIDRVFNTVTSSKSIAWNKLVK